MDKKIVIEFSQGDEICEICKKAIGKGEDIVVIYRSSSENSTRETYHISCWKAIRTFGDPEPIRL